jgi:hypothetical protein
MGEATKSGMTCRDCGTSVRVMRLQWLDTFPEGSRWYDDHVCLGCGRYASQPGVSLCEVSLLEYRRKYGRVIAPRSRTWLPRPARRAAAAKR